MYRTFLLAGLGLCSMASAQQPASLLPPMDNMVVTASRTPLDPLNVGSGYTIIDRELIDQRQAVFALDLLRDVPGISISRSGSIGSQTQLRMRGAESNHVLVFIDGVKVNDPAGNDEFALEHLTTFDIERIEVIRGPQSALWGSDALGGVINIITRRAREPFAAESFIEGGAFNTFSGGGRLALAGERLQGALNVSHLNSGGTNIAATGDENDGYRNTTASFNGGWQPAEGLDLSLFLRHSENRNESDAVDFATGQAVDADRLGKTSQTYMRLGGRLQASSGRAHELRLTLLDTDIGNFADGDPDGATAAEKYGVYYQGTTALFSAKDAGFEDRLTLALEYEHESYEQRGLAMPFGDPNQDRTMHSRAAVLEYLLQPLAGMSVSGSVRQDRNSDFDNITTWRSTASWRPGEGATRLHASFGTGQKSPTFVERFGFFSDSFVGNPELKPERSRGWDVGVEQSLLDERLVVDTTYFRADLRDEINGFVFDGDSGAFTAANIDGRSRRKGVEVALRARLADSLRLTANWTWLDATQPGGNGQEREIRRPRSVFSGNLNYRFAAQRANLNLNLSSIGARQDTDFSAGESVRLSSYTLMNLSASYRLDDLITLYARVENLLDEDYQDVFGFNTPGVGAYAGVRVNWGR